MPYKTKYFPKNPTKYIGDPSKILCRSLWERRFCKFLDENCHILKWSFETLKIPYISPKDNDIHIYYPDFIVEKKNKDGNIKTIVVEIKPYKQTQEPKKKKSTRNMLMESLTFSINIAKWDAAKTFCAKYDWEFIILTEKELFK
jgi:hypothetical protein